MWGNWEIEDEHMERGWKRKQGWVKGRWRKQCWKRYERKEEGKKASDGDIFCWRWRGKGKFREIQRKMKIGTETGYTLHFLCSFFNSIFCFDALHLGQLPVCLSAHFSKISISLKKSDRHLKPTDGWFPSCTDCLALTTLERKRKTYNWLTHWL